MRRCFELAKKGILTTKSNPIVGAVLVYKNRIIGEGYHEIYGKSHAEVNCFASVKDRDQKFIKESTLYVSLEPCCHYGKTPPCVELIKSHKIKKIVFSALDVNEKTRGKSLDILQQTDIEVEHGLLEKEGEHLLHKFRVNHLKGRAFITLKWASTLDGFAGKSDKSVWYSNSYSKVFAHRLRGKSECILIGSNTILVDNPLLSNRLSWGNNPYLVILDRKQKITIEHQIFNQDRKIFLFTQQKIKQSYPEHVEVHRISDFDLNKILGILYKDYHITSILVEGGPTIHKLFIEQNLWDQAFIIQTNKKQQSGIKSPIIKGILHNNFNLLQDRISHIVNNIDV